MECAGSHLPGSCLGPATLRCGSCGAVRYCSRQHQKRHWREHAQECGRMALQMQRAPELYDFPFSFAHLTTRLPEEAEEKSGICSLLESWGVHGAGVWKASCDCFQMGEVASQVNADWTLPASSCPCEPPEDSPPRELQNWEDFYNWRSLPFDSRVALILHWSMSLYHAICISQSQIQNPKSLRLHYLGPERELAQLPAFAEILALFSGTLFHIDFVGPAVPVLRDGESLEFSTFCRCSDVDCACKKNNSVVSKGGVTMRLWRGLYHDRFAELRDHPPDLIFAANAGLDAFSSWHPTLRLIESLLNVPAVFTDYREEAAVMAVQTILHLSRGRHPGTLAIPVQVNPFRQPLSPSHNDLDLPTFSNGFLFRINCPAYPA